MKDPVRLLSSGSPDARELLRSARVDAPSRAQLDHLAAKLAPTVVGVPATTSLLPWLFAGAALLGAAGIALVARDRAPTSTPAPAVVASPATPAPAVVASPATPAPTAPEVIAQVAPAIESAPSTVVPSPPKQRAKPRPVIERAVPAVDPTPAPIAEPAPAPPIAETMPPIAEPPPPIVEAPPREMDLLTPAHAALRANDAKRALALAERHAALYAAGAFAEEREAIAIEAMHRLGERDRARTRLAAFTASYPRSSYRTRLDRLVRE